jgi:RNA polymerase sigma-70 factor (ECF subfamily)
MLKRYPGVARWEQTDDVLQQALMRLDRALKKVTPPTPRDYFRFAAAVIRRELIALARHYYGPQGMGRHHRTRGGKDGERSGSRPVVDQGDQTHDPDRLAAWSEFHLAIEALPTDQLEIFDLLFYQGLTQAEAAGILGISERTVKRRWSEARQALYDALGGRFPS